MDTLENKRFLASDNFTAENILYYGSTTLLVLDFLAAVVLIAKWYLSDQHVYLDWWLILFMLLCGLFSWAFVMVFLKISNLLRHLYNRLDDSVLENEITEDKINE